MKNNVGCALSKHIHTHSNRHEWVFGYLMQRQTSAIFYTLFVFSKHFPFDNAKNLLKLGRKIFVFFLQILTPTSWRFVCSFVYTYSFPYYGSFPVQWKHFFGREKFYLFYVSGKEFFKGKICYFYSGYV